MSNSDSFSNHLSKIVSYPSWLQALRITDSRAESGDNGASSYSDFRQSSEQGGVEKFIDAFFCKLDFLKTVISRQKTAVSSVSSQHAQIDGENEIDNERISPEYENAFKLVHILYEKNKYEASVDAINLLLNSQNLSQSLREELLDVKIAILADDLPISPKKKANNIEEALDSYAGISDEKLSFRAMSVKLHLLSLKYRTLPDLPSKKRCLESLLQQIKNVLANQQNSPEEKSRIPRNGDQEKLMLTKAWLLTDLIEEEKEERIRRRYIISLMRVIIQLLMSSPRCNHYWNLCAYSLPFISHISDSHQVILLERACSLLESIVPFLDERNSNLYGNMAWLHIKLAKITKDPHVSAYSLVQARDLLDARSSLLKEYVGSRKMRMEAYHYHLSITYTSIARVECVLSRLAVTSERKIKHLHSAVSLSESALRLNPFNTNARARHTKATVMLLEHNYSQPAMVELLKSSLQSCIDALSFAEDPAQLYHAMSLAYRKLSTLSEEDTCKDLAKRYARLSVDYNVQYK